MAQLSTNQTPPKHRGNLIWILLVLLVIVAIGLLFWRSHTTYQPNTVAQTTVGPTAQTASNWKYGGVASSDPYGADPDVVKLSGGRYRMYTGELPDAPANGHAIISAISTDGKTWQPESGARIPNASFPDVIQLKDGSWRMYFQRGDVIASATSSDGLTWTEDPRVKIGSANDLGLTFYQVGAPSTMIQDDGTYTMVYAGYINHKYSGDVPNQDTHVLLWATSSDGVTWTKRGMAVDSRNATYQGWLDGPDWSKWSTGWKLFYWSYDGIYAATFDGKSFGPGQLQFQGQFPNTDPLAKFIPNPPGDPSLIQIGTTWFMYYDSFKDNKDAVYYATLPQG